MAIHQLGTISAPKDGAQHEIGLLELAHLAATTEHVLNVPTGQLVPADDNPRDSSGDVSELARSIASNGVLQPLIVVLEPEFGYRIVCGERRWRAAIKAGLRAVPCLVRALNDLQRQEAMLIENLHRRTLRPVEEARAYDRLLKLGYTQTRIAERLGRSQGHVCRRLSLLRLPKEVQIQVDQRELRLNQALGYEASPPADVFAADETLHLAWIALRQEVIDKGDRRLARLLHQFASAYLERARFAGPPNSERTRMVKAKNPPLNGRPASAK
jgi:ParB/RepB/Spo0J family partition protein